MKAFAQAPGIWRLGVVGGQEFESKVGIWKKLKLYHDFVYIILLSEKWHFSLCHTVLFSELCFNRSIQFHFDYETKISCDWKEQQLNQLNKPISRNLFSLVWGALEHKSFHMARHLTSNLIPGSGNFTKSNFKSSNVQVWPGGRMLKFQIDRYIN